ncbi:MAG: hypothetical protein WDN76_10590 [Alphaproteobacteria bacterium]
MKEALDEGGRADRAAHLPVPPYDTIEDRVVQTFRAKQARHRILSRLATA